MNEGLAEYTGYALAAPNIDERIPSLARMLATAEKGLALATKKAEVQAALRAKFVKGPLLTIPLSQMQFTFDPGKVQPFGELGSVYPSMEVRDVWGMIRVTGGGLISSDHSRLVVPANGEGYELELNEGWKIVPGPRDGDRTLSR
jgi:hypothetical protein